MNHYWCHHVYVTKKRGEQDSDCIEFLPHNTPLPYNSSSENSIIAARELAYVLKNAAPQASFSNIGDYQILEIEQLSKILPKAADNVKSTTDLPQQQPEQKAAIIPQIVQPGWTKYIPSVQPNVIEDEEGKEPKNDQNKVHMSPSGPIIIHLEVPIPPPRVNTAQPPRVDKGGPSSNLISICKKTPWPRYALTAQCPKTHEPNSVTHQISGVAQEYRHLIKGPEREIWEISFANELRKLAQGIKEVKGTNTVIFIPKYQFPKDKK